MMQVPYIKRRRRNSWIGSKNQATVSYSIRFSFETGSLCVNVDAAARLLYSNFVGQSPEKYLI